MYIHMIYNLYSTSIIWAPLFGGSASQIAPFWCPKPSPDPWLRRSIWPLGRDMRSCARSCWSRGPRVKHPAHNVVGNGNAGPIGVEP